MQPTNARDDRSNAIRTRPPCGIVGYPSAWAKLERVQDDRQIAVLDRLVRASGFAGPAALGWYAGILLWEAGLRDFPPAPRTLAVEELDLIEKRAAADLRAAADPLTFPKMRGVKRASPVKPTDGARLASPGDAEAWATR